MTAERDPPHPPADPIADLASLDLATIARMAAEQRLPPVASWNPAHCGHSDMRIAADGTWYYQGSPIGRPAMVRLFSTVLRREPDGSHVLVTPVEKLSITVDDAPFVAVEARIEGEGQARRIAFRLNTGDLVVAGADHPIRVDTAADGTPRPYLHVRDGLQALINRAVFYQLADLAIDEQSGPKSGPKYGPESGPGLWSEGAWFAFAD